MEQFYQVVGRWGNEALARALDFWKALLIQS
jgi:hypothetical protein